MDIGSIGETNRLLVTSKSAAGTKTASSLQTKTEVPAPSTGALEAWDRIVQAMENNNTLQMNFDRELNRVIVQVINRNSQEVITQIPSQEALNIMRRLRQYLSLITDGRV
jgi:flagellar protein FlaG